MICICLIFNVQAITSQSNEGWSASGKSIEKMSIAKPEFNFDPRWRGVCPEVNGRI